MPPSLPNLNIKKEGIVNKSNYPDTDSGSKNESDLNVFANIEPPHELQQSSSKENVANMCSNKEKDEKSNESTTINEKVDSKMFATNQDTTFANNKLYTNKVQTTELFNKLLKYVLKEEETTSRPNCPCDMSDDLITVLHVTETYSMFSVLGSDQSRDRMLAGGLDVSTFKTNNQNGDTSEKPYKHPLMDVKPKSSNSSSTSESDNEDIGNYPGNIAHWMWSSY